MTRNRAGTYIKHLVEGLAGNMRFAAASRAGRAIECLCEKRTLLISGSDFRLLIRLRSLLSRKLYPVNFLREFDEKLLRHSGFFDAESASKA